MKRFLSVCFLIFLMFSPSFSQENTDVQKRERHYLDYYSTLPYKDELARIDAFLISFSEYPEAKALIVLYFDKTANSRDNIYRIRRIFDYTKRRKFKSRQILFAITKENSKEQTFLWQIFPGDDISEFVNQNSTLIKGEEFEEKLKNSFINKKL